MWTWRRSWLATLPRRANPVFEFFFCADGFMLCFDLYDRTVSVTYEDTFLDSGGARPTLYECV